MQCMDRDALQEMLGEGLSLAEIGRRVGRHEATVSYWLDKYGLKANNRGRHAARGGIEREALEASVAAGKSIAEIAAEVGRSRATVRHWLMRYDLKTDRTVGRSRRAQLRGAIASGAEVATLNCRRHGETAFVLDGSGSFRCRRCRAEAVSNRRRRVKQLLVAEAGGACQICGYSRNVGALQFHHVDPASKRIEIARGAALAISTLREETAKCVLLCGNCHAEVEAGLVTLDPGRPPP